MRVGTAIASSLPLLRSAAEEFIKEHSMLPFLFRLVWIAAATEVSKQAHQ